MVHHESHAQKSGTKLNWLRAAVLGANDGIVSVAAMVVGEYVSVSSQRDTERALLAKDRNELETVPDAELAELATIYEAKGLSKATAYTVAAELTAHDAFAAHAEAELHIDPDELTNPWHAAYASAAAFLAGAVVPLVAILLPPASLRIPVTFAAVLVALVITGTLSAHIGGANKMRATLRVVVGGALAMAITFGIGKMFGVIGV